MPLPTACLHTRPVGMVGGSLRCVLGTACWLKFRVHVQPDQVLWDLLPQRLHMPAFPPEVPGARSPTTLSRIQCSRFCQFRRQRWTLPVLSYVSLSRGMSLLVCDFPVILGHRLWLFSSCSCCFAGVSLVDTRQSVWTQTNVDSSLLSVSDAANIFSWFTTCPWTFFSVFQWTKCLLMLRLIESLVFKNLSLCFWNCV